MDVTFFEEVPFYPSSSRHQYPKTDPSLPVSIFYVPHQVPKRFKNPPIVYIRRSKDDVSLPALQPIPNKLADLPLVI